MATNTTKSKTVQITKNKSMKLPPTFTLKELLTANPGLRYNTAYQRVQVLVTSGELIAVGDVKRPNNVQKVDENGAPVFKTEKDGSFSVDADGNKIPVMEKKMQKGRTEAVYRLPDANPNSNLIRQVVAQGRVGNITTNVPVASVEAPAETPAAVDDTTPATSEADASTTPVEASVDATPAS